MEGADLFNLALQFGDTGTGEDCHSVLISFPGADHEGVSGEVDIFHSQGSAFNESDSGSIEQACHEMFCVFEIV